MNEDHIKNLKSLAKESGATITDYIDYAYSDPVVLFEDDQTLAIFAARIAAAAKEEPLELLREARKEIAGLCDECRGGTDNTNPISSYHLSPILFGVNFFADSWFRQNHARNVDLEFASWWVYHYGAPDDYENTEYEQHEYWIRCAFALTGWRASRGLSAVYDVNSRKT